MKGNEKETEERKQMRKRTACCFCSALAYISHVALAAYTSPQPAANLIAAKVHMLAASYCSCSAVLRKVWKSLLARKKSKQHATNMASSWLTPFLIIWLAAGRAMGFPWLLPLLSNTHPRLHCRPAATQHTLHRHG